MNLIQNQKEEFIINRRTSSNLTHQELMKKTKSTKLMKKENHINSRIIQLIKQKKYPLNQSNRSPLLFPKIKQKKLLKTNDRDESIPKKYIQINLDADKTKSENKLRTDIQHELLHQYKVSSNKKDKEVLNFQQTLFKKLQKYEKDPHKKRRPTQRNSLSQNRYSSCHQANIKQIFKNLDFMKEHECLENQLQNHNDTLDRFKDEIVKQKSRYLDKINLTDILDPSKDKQNVNIEFIVHQLQRKKQKQTVQKKKPMAYQDLSPNHIPDFMKLFNARHQTTPNLWQQFEENEALKQKIHEDELRSTHLIKTCPDQKTTIVEEEEQIKQENILSAKYRLKTNHKKMIQISKAKNK